MRNSRQSCSSESSTQSDVPSQCQLPGIHRPVAQRNCPNSHPEHSQNSTLLNEIFLSCNNKSGYPSLFFSNSTVDYSVFIITINVIIHIQLHPKKCHSAYLWLLGRKKNLLNRMMKTIIDKFLTTFHTYLCFFNQAWGGGGRPPLMKHVVNIIDKPWRRACQPSPWHLHNLLRTHPEPPFDVPPEWHL